MADKYIKGLFTKRHEKAPEFVLANLSIKTEDFISWLQENKNEKGYVNIDILQGNDWPYSKKNEWKAEKKQENKQSSEIEDLPF